MPQNLCARLKNQLNTCEKNEKGIGWFALKSEQKKWLRFTNMETLFEIEYYNGHKNKINNPFFKNYSKARIRAHTLVNQKNKGIVNNNWKHNTENINSFFTETAPDYWTDGKEIIKIIVIDVKS